MAESRHVPLNEVQRQIEDLNKAGRWWSHESLAEHDREVAEKAWDEACQWNRDQGMGVCEECSRAANPYMPQYTTKEKA